MHSKTSFVVILLLIIHGLTQQLSGQNFPEGISLIEPKPGSNHLKDSTAFLFEEIKSKELIDTGLPRLLFFTFKGCAGCKMVANDVLIPYHNSLSKEFEMDIVAIAKSPHGKDQEIAIEYMKLPFKVLLDRDDDFFANTRQFVSNEKYINARPQILLLVSDNEIVSIPTEAIFTYENLAHFLREELMGRESIE